MLDFKLAQDQQQDLPREGVVQDDDQVYDVIIIGGAPAGFTAAIYAGRAALKTLVLTGPLLGGQGFGDLAPSAIGVAGNRRSSIRLQRLSQWCGGVPRVACPPVPPLHWRTSRQWHPGLTQQPEKHAKA